MLVSYLTIYGFRVATHYNYKYPSIQMTVNAIKRRFTSDTWGTIDNFEWREIYYLCYGLEIRFYQKLGENERE